MIDRKKLLSSVALDEDKLLLARLCDLCQKAESSGRRMYSKFLNPGEIMLAKEKFSFVSHLDFFGGYEGADRCVAAFGDSSWDMTPYPISILKISPLGKKEYTHRDYLGSLLSLGIERELLGDIVMSDGSAFVFALSDICDFISMNLLKIASSPVKISFEKELPKELGDLRFETVSATVSSLRLDSVVSAITKKSRAVSSDLISQGKVSLNYKEETSSSKQIKDKDTVAVRGFGKAIIETSGNLTKKGRIHINIKKYK